MPRALPSIWWWMEPFKKCLNFISSFFFFFSKWKGNFFFFKKEEEEKSREFIDFKEQLTFLVILRVNYIKSIKSIWCSWLCFFFPPYLSTILEQQPDPLHLYTFSLSSDDEGGAKRQLKTEGQRTTLHIPWKHISSFSLSLRIERIWK